MAEVLTPRTVVCAGAVDLASGKIGVKYFFVDPWFTLIGDPFFFEQKSKVMGSGKVGCVYEVDTSNDATTMHAPLRFKQMWPNEAQLLEWRANDDLTTTRARLEKSRKSGEREAREKALDALEPIRKLHRGTDNIGRRLLEAQVLEYIRR